MSFAATVLRKIIGSHPKSEVGLSHDLPSAECPPIRFVKHSTLHGHTDRVWALDWHPSGKILASCGGDKTVKIWGVDSEGSWRVTQSLEGEHQRTIRSVSWSDDGTSLACASFDATVSVWVVDPSSGELQVDSVLDGHENEVKSVSWKHSQTETALATCSRDKTVWVWEKSHAAEEGDFSEYECAGVLGGHVQDVKRALWAPSWFVERLNVLKREQTAARNANEGGEVNVVEVRNAIVSCGYDDTVKLWEEGKRKDDWHCTQTLLQHEGTVWDVCFPPWGPHLNPQGEIAAPLLFASCGDDLTLKLWGTCESDKGEAAGTLKCIANLGGVGERSLYSLDWWEGVHKDGGFQQLAAGGGYSKKGKAGGGEEEEEPSISFIAVASGDDSITLVALKAGETTNGESMGSPVSLSIVGKQENSHSSDVNCVRFCPSVGGPLLASASDDGEICIWSLQSTSV